MTELKTIVVVGASTTSWEDAVRQVVRKAAESIPQIASVDVVHQTARVENGDIAEYRATVHVSFELPADDASATE